MAQSRRRTQQPGMTMQQFNMQIQQQLISGGYSRQQATTIMGLAGRLARGQNVAVNQSWLDVNDLNRIASTMANGRARPRQRREILSDLTLLHGPVRSPTIRTVPRRTPERTYAYRVTMGTRTYEVVSRTELPARSGTGTAGLARSRLGQLRQALVEGASGMRVYAVSSTGARRQLNAAQRQQFARTYVGRYNRMERSMLGGQRPEDLITVASIRRRPSSG